MKAGKYTVYVLETGRFALDGGAVFGVIPKALWSQRVTTDEKNRTSMTLRSILIVGSGCQILVDTGFGEGYSDKIRKIYRMDTVSVNLKNSLVALGFTFDDITDVIFTHLHFDHANGAIDQSKKLPLFSNATYLCPEAQFRMSDVTVGIRPR